MTAAAAITANFKTEPYSHQLKEFEISAELPARALLWQMRTGKSKVVIDTACHLYIAGHIDAVLIFAPNGVHENWIRRELYLHAWDNIPRQELVWRTTEAADGVQKGRTERARRWRSLFKEMLSSGELSWLAFNSESMTRDDVRKYIKRFIGRKRVLAVFDESQDFRTPGSRRSRMARSIARHCAYKRILTGTPVTNSPLHAWGQYELLKKGALGFDRYSDFKMHHAIYALEKNRAGQNYPKLQEYIHLDELRDAMAPWSSIVLREDCEDLPSLVRRVRQVPLSMEQLRLYRELHAQFSVEIAGQEVSIGEMASRLTKLQQIVGGFLIDEYRDTYIIPGPCPRLDAVSDEVYLASGRVIVWCRFREDMDRVYARLKADGHEIVQYHGRIDANEKARVRALFAPGAENNVKALVGYPTVGIDLSSASEIIWYSHTFDAIERTQADERATAVGGGNVQIVDLVADGPDEYILENVLQKISIAEEVAGEELRDILLKLEL